MLGLSTQYKEQSVLATVNLVLIIVGYQLLATVTSPFINAQTSQLVTVPYRAVVLGLQLYLIARYRQNGLVMNGTLRALVILWLIIVFRFEYDHYVQTSFPVDEEGFQKVALFMYGMCIPASISIAKTCWIIDYKLAMKILLASFALIAIYNVLFNTAMTGGEGATTDGRITGGAILNTISFGYCGTSLSILSLVEYSKVKKRIYRLTFMLLLCLGVFIVLKAGSRGPLVVLLALVMLYLSLTSRYKIGIVITFVFLLAVLLVFGDVIINGIREVSPVMAGRLTSSVEDGDSSGRDTILNGALKVWEQNVLFGSQFALYGKSISGYSPGYSHNIITDALIYGGIFGGAIMVWFFILVTKSVRHFYFYHKNLFGLVLLVAQVFYSCLFSGCFWFTPFLSCGIIILSQASYIQSED
jgi:hypothetical protein